MKNSRFLWVLVFLGLLVCVLGCERTPPQPKTAADAPPVPIGVEQVQIFIHGQGPTLATEAAAGLQRRVNLWLAENSEGIEITRVLQSGDDAYGLVLTVFYKRTK